MIKAFFLLLIRGYKKGISPLLGNNCRFYPTCSAYTYEAIEKHGVLKGVYLGVRRILKCQPFHAGGYDPVPGLKSAKSSTDATPDNGFRKSS
ncbi:MAG: membrane protein insertion efficiency factor YidD [bacterium]|nr:membrane protein insertion efficiency factor YidD [bacterium]